MTENKIEQNSNTTAVKLCQILPEVIYMTTGDRIKAAREKRRLSQSALAEKLHVSFSLISQYERGTRNPKRETLEKIAAALEIPVVELLGASVNPTDAKKGVTMHMSVYEKIDNILYENHMSRRKLANSAGIPPSTFQSIMPPCGSR